MSSTSSTAAGNPAGYPLQSFTAEDQILINEVNLICAICQDVCRGAGMCFNQHNFCKVCLLAWAKKFPSSGWPCPICKVNITSFQKNAIGQRILDRMVIRCENSCSNSVVPGISSSVATDELSQTSSPRKRIKKNDKNEENTLALTLSTGLPSSVVETDFLSSEEKLDQCGCTWMGLLEGYDAHASVCAFALVFCLDCEGNIFRSELEEHQKSTCSNRKIQCEHCYSDILWNSVADHEKKDCSYFSVACTNPGCTELVSRRFLSSHQTNYCSFRETTCKYSSFGCTWTGLVSELSVHEAHESIHVNLFGSALLRLQKEAAAFKKSEEDFKDQLAYRLYKLSKIFVGHRSKIDHVAFLKGEKWGHIFVSVDSSGVLKSWHSQSGRCLSTIPLGCTIKLLLPVSYNSLVVLICDGEYIDNIYHANFIKILDVLKTQYSPVNSEMRGCISAVELAGDRIAVVTELNISIFDLVASVVIRELTVSGPFSIDDDECGVTFRCVTESSNFILGSEAYDCSPEIVHVWDLRVDANTATYNFVNHKTVHKFLPTTGLQNIVACAIEYDMSMSIQTWRVTDTFAEPLHLFENLFTLDLDKDSWDEIDCSQVKLFLRGSSRRTIYLALPSTLIGLTRHAAGTPEFDENDIVDQEVNGLLQFLDLTQPPLPRQRVPVRAIPGSKSLTDQRMPFAQMHTSPNKIVYVHDNPCDLALCTINALY